MSDTKQINDDDSAAPSGSAASPIAEDIHSLRSAIAAGSRMLSDTRRQVFIAASLLVASAFFFYWFNSLLDPSTLYTTYYHIFFAAAYALLGASAFFESELYPWQRLLATWLMVPALIILTFLNGALPLVHMATYITGSYIVSGVLYARTSVAAILLFTAYSALTSSDEASQLMYQRVLITGVLNLITIEVFLGGIRGGIRGIRAAADQLDDMSERLQRDFHDRQQTLEEKNREYLKESVARAEKVALRNLSSSISHEFLNPLKAMQGVNQVLKECSSEERRKQLLLASDAALDHLCQITEWLLDVRQVRGGHPVLKEPLDVRRLLTTLETAAVSRMLEKPVRCELEVDPHIPALLLGDETRLRQILFNLTGALYLGQSGGTLQFGAKLLESFKSSVKLAFIARYCVDTQPRSVLECDFGPGHGEGQIDSEGANSGLGRLVATELLKSLGGSSLAESVTQADRYFAFTLTLEKADDSELSERTIAPAGALPLKGLRILVVDDNQLSRLMTEELLKRQGATTIAANNGLQALNTLDAERGQVSLVLMDVQMPVLDGVEATRLIRSGEMTSQIPVIAVTANTLPEDLELYHAVGMDDCLPKPIDAQELITCVLQHCTVT